MEIFPLYEKLSLDLETSLGKTLVLADLHIAFELSRGLRIRTRFEKSLANFIKSKNPDLLIILGDVKESIGLEAFTKKLLIEFFSEISEFKTVITKGNHDGKIEEITEAFDNIKITDYFLLDGILFLHGHQLLPGAKFEKAILGHIHPTVSVRIGNAVKKTKCFFKINKFLILPTVNPYIEGFDVREGIKMVPFLKQSSMGEAYLPDGTYLGVIELNPKT